MSDSSIRLDIDGQSSCDLLVARFLRLTAAIFEAANKNGSVSAAGRDWSFLDSLVSLEGAYGDVDVS